MTALLLHLRALRMAYLRLVSTDSLSVDELLIRTVERGRKPDVEHIGRRLR